MKTKPSSKCPDCKGTGKFGLSKCTECDGTGKAQRFQMMFWPYDQFPFILASRGFMYDNGTCYCPAYNGRFRPVKVMSLEEGEKVKADLDTIEHERHTMLTIIERSYRVRLRMIAPWAIKK